MGTGRRVGLLSVLLCAVPLVVAALARSPLLSPPASGMNGSSLQAGLAVAMTPAGLQQEPTPERTRFVVVAKRYQFTPARIEVHVDDLVKVVFSTEDIPHSFTVDEYRIAKRAAPGRPVTFDFLANKAGTFVFYCNLTTEEGCRRMHGELVVLPR